MTFPNTQTLRQKHDWEGWHSKPFTSSTGSAKSSTRSARVTKWSEESCPTPTPRAAEESKRITGERWLRLSSREETAGEAVLGLGKVSKALSEMDWNWHSHWGVTAAKVQFSRISGRNSKLDLRLHFKELLGVGSCCSSDLEWQCCVRRGGALH